MEILSRKVCASYTGLGVSSVIGHSQPAPRPPRALPVSCPRPVWYVRTIPRTRRIAQGKKNHITQDEKQRSDKDGVGAAVKQGGVRREQLRRTQPHRCPPIACTGSSARAPQGYALAWGCKPTRAPLYEGHAERGRAASWSVPGSTRERRIETDKRRQGEERRTGEIEEDGVDQEVETGGQRA